MSKEPFLVYLMNEQGKHQKPTTIYGVREAAEYAIQHADKYPEIRVCDVLDCLVFHIENGRIVFPNLIEDVPVEVTASEQTNTQPIPFVVFVADVPADADTAPELSLPSAHAVDAEEACKMVTEAYKDVPNCVVLDAMDYDRLMETADMLEEEEPDYPEEGLKPKWRPLDIGWAVRRLKKGSRVRFNTWNKGEYIEYRDGRILDRTGTPWRPSQKEIMTSGWEVADQ